MQTYTLRDIASLLGLSRGVVRGLIEAGFVQPGRGRRGEYRFSFQDMVLLRTARSLQAADIAPRRILRALRRLRAALPAQMPLSGLRIAAVGNEIVVRDGGAPWRADSGQRLFDFELGPAAEAGTTVRELRRVAPAAHPAEARAPAAPAAEAAPAAGPDWFQRGVQLERSDPAAAEAAYRRAMQCRPERSDAFLNLGVLLGEAGRHAEAAEVYHLGLALHPGEALLHFNLGVTLEDAGQHEAAVRCYEQALATDPALADAHFNLARLHEQRGRARLAIRHYSAYRRLSAPPGRGG